MDVRLALLALLVSLIAVGIRHVRRRPAWPPVRAWWLLWAAAAVAILRDHDPSWAGSVVRPGGGVIPSVALWVLASVFVVVNMRRQAAVAASALAFFWAGFSANSWVTVWNAGMPFDPRAAVAAGIPAQRIHEPPPGHVPIGDGTSFAAMGDVVPVPLLQMVVSAGDVLMVVGAVLFVATATRPHGTPHVAPSTPREEVTT